jgi:hypothetical protein
MNEENVMEALNFFKDTNAQNHEASVKFNKNVMNAADAIHRDAYTIAALKSSTIEMKTEIEKQRHQYEEDFERCEIHEEQA